LVTPVNPVNSANFFISGYQKGTMASEASASAPEINDSAIISAQAKLLNELEKYNAGESDEISLAVTAITSKHEAEANVYALKVHKECMDSVLDIIH